MGGEVGPHVFPTVLALLLGIVGASLAVRALSAKRISVEKESDEMVGEATPLRALGVLGIGALYIPAALLLGYVPALFLLIASIALYERAKLSWRMAAIAAGGALLFWLLFVAILGVRQPESILF